MNKFVKWLNKIGHREAYKTLHAVGVELSTVKAWQYEASTNRRPGIDTAWSIVKLLEKKHPELNIKIQDVRPRKK
jgi:hypothetical protein